MAGQLVFMGGLHRSGTTLLAGLIGTSSQVGGLYRTGAPMDEGQHLQTVCPTDEHHGGPGRFAHRPEAHMTEDDPLATDRTARLLLDQWGRYWDAGRPVLLEKSPPNLLRFRFFQRLFPQARFVLVNRHPIPVAMSTRKWTPALSVRQLVEHWLHANDIALADAAHLRDLLVVRYEEVVADPATTLKTVAQFVDVPADFRCGALDGEANGRYLARWRAGPGARDDLADLEPRLRKHGYSLDFS